jgi:hypothetical protein
MSESTSQEETARLIDEAVGEFKRNGVVKETKCDNCNKPITVERVGEDAYKISCPCGIFWGSIRGI